MMNVDMWTWTCARCGWRVKDKQTVNEQQAVADALVRMHIQEHQRAELASQEQAPHEETNQRAIDASEQSDSDRREAGEPNQRDGIGPTHRRAVRHAKELAETKIEAVGAGDVPRDLETALERQFAMAMREAASSLSGDVQFYRGKAAGIQQVLDGIRKHGIERADTRSRPSLDWQKLTRLEVITDQGRVLSCWGCHVEPSVQDNGRTLKLIVDDLPKASSPTPPPEAPMDGKVNANS